MELPGLRKKFLFVLEFRMGLMQHLRLKNNLKVEFLRFNTHKYIIEIQTDFLPSNKFAGLVRKILNSLEGYTAGALLSKESGICYQEESLGD